MANAGRLVRVHLFQEVAQYVDYFQILALVVAADVVGLARPAFEQHLDQGAGMVLDIEPVADLAALAIDRQRLALQGVKYGQRDQLLGEVVGAVVVGAIGGNRRQAVGVMPGAHQVIGRGLAGGIGRVGLVASRLGEQAGGVQAAIDLVGGDMVEAEAGLLPVAETIPVMARRLQQGVGADDVGLDELGRAVDGAVDVALGGQVHDAVRPVLGEQAADLGGVADVHFFKGITRVAGDAGDRIEVAGIGQAIDVDYPVIGVGDQVADDGGTDETGAAGDEQGLGHGQGFG